MPRDIVYILKPDIVPDELRYSLRSLENFPHRKVFFVCGCPEGFKPDGHIKHTQQGNSKWELIRSSMREVLKCDEITEDFFLFNDDFFIMKPFKGDFVNMVDGTLMRRIDELFVEKNGLNPHARTLYKLNAELTNKKLPTMNYDLHTPMLINKTLMRSSVNVCSSPQMRSAYGNINRIPYVLHPDVKVYDYNTVPKSPDFLSTNEDTFEKGKVGQYIRSTFTTPSRFEE